MSLYSVIDTCRFSHLCQQWRIYKSVLPVCPSICLSFCLSVMANGYFRTHQGLSDKKNDKDTIQEGASTLLPGLIRRDKKFLSFPVTFQYFFGSVGRKKKSFQKEFYAYIFYPESLMLTHSAFSTYHKWIKFNFGRYNWIKFHFSIWLLAKIKLCWIRQLALYSTNDGSSYELKLCPTRKKSSHLSFYFIFSSDMRD